MFDFIDCSEAETLPGYEPKLRLRFGGSRVGAAAVSGAHPCGWRSPPTLRLGRGGSSYPMVGVTAGIPHPGRRYPALAVYLGETCMASILCSLLLCLLCLKLSGSLRPAGVILNTLVILDAWLFTPSSRHHL